MVRKPPGLHPQRGWYGTSQLSWLPGLRGSGQQPIQQIPITRYRNRLQGVPLTGGQAQGVIAALPSGSGTVTSPSTFQNLFVVGPIPPGTYTAAWTVTLSGVVGAGDANNFRLTQGTATAPVITLGFSTNAGSAGSYPQTAASFTVAAGTGSAYLLLRTGGNTPTTGAVYGGSITITGPVGITLQVGPQGLGTVWYPVQVTLSTTTGVLDTSTANVYLGPLTTPATLVGTVFTGNGTVALAIPDMTPGQTLIVTWSNANAGDTAAFNTIGTMDALGT